MIHDAAVWNNEVSGCISRYRTIQTKTRNFAQRRNWFTPRISVMGILNLTNQLISTTSVSEGLSLRSKRIFLSLFLITMTVGKTFLVIKKSY